MCYLEKSENLSFLAQTLLELSQKKTTEGGSTLREHTKCLIFDYEMCTLQKVGGEDSNGRKVLWMPETSLKQVI